MPKPTGQPAVNWDAIPDQQTADSGINWNAIPDQSGNASIGPREGNTTANWLSDVEDDIRHGGTKTLPGRVLHKMGAPGLEEGSQSQVGDIMGGPLIGVPEIAHGLVESGASSNPDVRTRDLNEIIHGVGHALTPLAETQPELIPTLASYGPVGYGARKVAEFAGASPDQAELASNLIMAGSGHGLEKTGDFLQRNAEPLGKAAGYGAAIAETAKTKNPLWLFTGAPHATKLAGDLIDTSGNVLSKIGGTMKPSVENPFGASEQTPVDQMPPKLLGKGSIVTPPPEPEPVSSGVQKAVVRGPGGRMTTQYRFGAPGTESDQTVYGSQPPLIQTDFGQPQEPPQVSPEFSRESTTAQPLTQQVNPDTIKPLVDTGMSRRDFMKRGAQAVGAAAASKLVPGAVKSLTEAPDLVQTGVTAPEATEIASQAAVPTLGPEVNSIASKTLTPKLSNTLFQAMKHFSDDYADQTGENPETAYGLVKPEDMGTQIQSIKPEGENNLVHFTAAPDDELGTSDYLATVDSKGNIIRVVSGFEEPHVIFDNKQFHFSGEGPELTPSEQSWGNQINGAESEGEPVRDTEEESGVKPSGTFPQVEQRNPEDLIDDRGIQQELRQGLENNEQSAQDFARRRMYGQNKPGYKTDIPGEEDNRLFPWAQHPYGR